MVAVQPRMAATRAAATTWLRGMDWRREPSRGRAEVGEVGPGPKSMSLSLSSALQMAELSGARARAGGAAARADTRSWCSSRRRSPSRSSFAFSSASAAASSSDRSRRASCLAERASRAASRAACTRRASAARNWRSAVASRRPPTTVSASSRAALVFRSAVRRAPSARNSSCCSLSTTAISLPIIRSSKVAPGSDDMLTVAVVSTPGGGMAAPDEVDSRSAKATWRPPREDLLRDDTPRPVPPADLREMVGGTTVPQPSSSPGPVGAAASAEAASEADLKGEGAASSPVNTASS
mmetsp:Transcript_21211/g.63851  ORF Transcript_21211/g.63851 Transcript_21211/m.63851 type:complete len:295 (+) Transcript_21211:656-1540(+)